MLQGMIGGGLLVVVFAVVAAAGAGVAVRLYRGTRPAAPRPAGNGQAPAAEGAGRPGAAHTDSGGSLDV